MPYFYKAKLKDIKGQDSEIEADHFCFQGGYDGIASEKDKLNYPAEYAAYLETLKGKDKEQQEDKFEKLLTTEKNPAVEGAASEQYIGEGGLSTEGSLFDHAENPDNVPDGAKESGEDEDKSDKDDKNHKKGKK